jgi:type I pantothenate kinase
MPRLSEPSPYVEFDRSQWRALRMSTPLKLSEDEVLKLRGLGEKLDLLEVEEVYLPLARLIHLQVAASGPAGAVRDRGGRKRRGG